MSRRQCSSRRFGMKGGTALNLFVQDMPRLSVDIDVVFTDHTLDREAALRAIGTELNAAMSAISAMGYSAVLPTTKSGDDVKLLVEGNGVRVKIEVNSVFRGTVLPVAQTSWFEGSTIATYSFRAPTCIPPGIPKLARGWHQGGHTKAQVAEIGEKELAESEGFEPGSATWGISNLLNRLRAEPPMRPLRPRGWHQSWHWNSLGLLPCRLQVTGSTD
jgi:hypothetical protein